jgi:hypothetical protein
VPVLRYILLVGSVLSGLIFYASSVMIPAPPFSVSQKSGLPEPYKAPVIATLPTPAVIATTADFPAQLKKATKAVRKHKPIRVVRQTTPREHYAVYPSRESQTIW